MEFKYSVELKKLIKDFPGMHFDLNVGGNHVVAGRRYVWKDDTCVDPRFRFDWPTNPGNGAFYIERRKLTAAAEQVARTIVWDPESDIRDQKSNFIELLKAQIKCCQHELKVQ